MSGAIYHVSVSTRTKAASGGGGGSAASTVAYISRHGEYAAVHDKVLHLESGNMPGWARAGKTDATKRACLTYWRAADAYERRNGRLAKVLIIALPKALGLEAQVDLSRAIAKSLTSEIDGGCLPWTLAVHGGLDSRGRRRNPHCHLMINERVNDGIERPPALWFRRATARVQGSPVQPEKGGARKTAALTPRAWLYGVRELIAKLINLALRDAGIPFRVNHRSNAARGLGRAPQPKLGPWAAWLEKQGVRTSLGDHLLSVMRSWRGPNLPVGPILTARPSQLFQLNTKVSLDSKPGVMQRDTTPVPRSEIMPAQGISSRPVVIRPRMVLRQSLDGAGSNPTVAQTAMTKWWLVIAPMRIDGSDSDAACKHLASPDYEKRMLEQFGNRLREVTSQKSPEPHRALLFADGTRARDYGWRVEMIGTAGRSVPPQPLELVTIAKGWSAVQIAGPEPIRRFVCRELNLAGVHTEEYKTITQDVAAAMDVKQTNASTDAPEDPSPCREYSPFSLGP